MKKIIQKLIRRVNTQTQDVSFPGVELHEKARWIEEQKAERAIEAGMGKEMADKVREMNRLGRQLRRQMGVK